MHWTHILLPPEQAFQFTLIMYLSNSKYDRNLPIIYKSRTLCVNIAPKGAKIGRADKNFTHFMYIKDIQIVPKDTQSICGIKFSWKGRWVEKKYF